GIVQVLQCFLTDVGDVAGDLFLPQLGVARDALELLDVDRGEHVVAQDALGDEDGVLEVVPLPGHEGDDHVLAQRQLPGLGGGAGVRSKGTACRCMFEPISARFASSFSRNGISEAATETSWFGDTSIRLMSSGRAWGNSPALRQETSGVRKWPFLSKVAFACAMTCFSSSSAE